MTELASRIEAEELAVIEAEKNAEQAAALLDDLAVLEARGQRTAEAAEQERAKLSQCVFDAGQQAQHRARVLEALRREHADAKRVADEARFADALEERDAAAREAVGVAGRYSTAASEANGRAISLEQARSKTRELHEHARALCPDDTDMPGLPVDEPDFPDVTAIARVAEGGSQQPASKASAYAAAAESRREQARARDIRVAVDRLKETPPATSALQELHAGILAQVPEADRPEVERLYAEEMAALREEHADLETGRREDDRLSARSVVGR